MLCVVASSSYALPIYYGHSRTPKKCSTITNLFEIRHLDVSNALVVLFLLPDQSCAIKHPATLNHITCMREFPQLMIAICVFCSCVTLASA